MSIRIAALVVVIAAIPIADGNAQDSKPQKNLIRNGDFSGGVKNWKGDGKAEVFIPDPAGIEEGGSELDAGKPAAATQKPASRSPFGQAPGKLGADVDRSYCVTLSSRSQKFFQSISVPRKAKGLKLTYRARTKTGFLSSRNSLGAFQVTFERVDGGSTYHSEKIENKPEWQMFTIDHAIREYSRSVNVIVEVFPGSGEIYFDDFVITAVE